jgi:hypothetical protein
MQILNVWRADLEAKTRPTPGNAVAVPYFPSMLPTFSWPAQAVLHEKASISYPKPIFAINNPRVTIVIKTQSFLKWCWQHAENSNLVSQRPFMFQCNSTEHKRENYSARSLSKKKLDLKSGSRSHDQQASTRWCCFPFWVKQLFVRWVRGRYLYLYPFELLKPTWESRINAKYKFASR